MSYQHINIINKKKKEKKNQKKKEEKLFFTTTKVTLIMSQLVDKYYHLKRTDFPSGAHFPLVPPPFETRILGPEPGKGRK